jgi:hypothetical protein
VSERAIELAKIREMKAVIAKKIADGDMDDEEAARIFKAITSDAPIAEPRVAAGRVLLGRFLRLVLTAHARRILICREMLT